MSYFCIDTVEDHLLDASIFILLPVTQWECHNGNRLCHKMSMIEQILHLIIHSDGRFFALPFCLAVQNSFVFQHVNNMSQELVSVKYISAPDWVG